MDVKTRASCFACLKTAAQRERERERGGGVGVLLMGLLLSSDKHTICLEDRQNSTLLFKQ